MGIDANEAMKLMRFVREAKGITVVPFDELTLQVADAINRLQEGLANYQDIEKAEWPSHMLTVDRFLGLILHGRTYDYRLDPELLVSQFIASYVGSSGVTDFLPTLQLCQLVGDWSGEPGSEPEWLIEADQMLAKHFYPIQIDSYNTEKVIFDPVKFANMSIPERARLLNPLTTNYDDIEELPISDEAINVLDTEDWLKRVTHFEAELLKAQKLFDIEIQRSLTLSDRIEVAKTLLNVQEATPKSEILQLAKKAEIERPDNSSDIWEAFHLLSEPKYAGLQRARAILEMAEFNLSNI